MLKEVNPFSKKFSLLLTSVQAPGRLHCDKALCKILVFFVDFSIDILYHFNSNITDTLVIMNSPSWYDFYAILPPEVRAVGFFLAVVTLAPCAT